MTSHPNRRKGFDPCQSPDPSLVQRVREWAGWTQEFSALTVCSALNSWQGWEAPKGTPTHRRMHPAFWRLYLIEVGLDPDQPVEPQLLKPPPARRGV